MKSKIILISVTILSILSKVSGQTQQADCSNIYLDTASFYISPPNDIIVSGNLFYMDTIITFYPILHILLTDTSVITSPETIVLSSLDSGYVQAFAFNINFKTTIFPNNTVVNGLFHIYDSDTPGDSIVTCYFPIKIILQNPTAISDSEIKSGKFKIYPNPTDKIATLEFDNSKNQNCTLTLYDTHGKLVRTINDITSGKIEIEKQNLTNGLYLFQLCTDAQVIATGKLTIE